MTQGADRPDRSTILGLVAMALAVLVVANDFTSLSVALPALERDFGVGVNKVQWVINGYALVFGVLIVTGDPSRSSLASGIVYMFQVAGGAVGLGVNTAIAHTTDTLVAGISRAFAVDALLATCGLLIALFFVGGWRVAGAKPAAAE